MNAVAGERSDVPAGREYSVVLGKNTHLLAFFQYIQRQQDLYTKPLTVREEFGPLIDRILTNGKKGYFNTENFSLAEAWSLVEENLRVNWTEARGLTNWELAYLVTAHPHHPGVTWWRGTEPLSSDYILSFRSE